MKNLFKEVLKFIPLLLLVFAFRSMAYEPYHITSGSMRPTLRV